jgi:hypothetical protein
MDDAAIDEVMLQDDDDDLVPQIVMSIDQFSLCSSIFILIVVALSLGSIHSGAFFPNPANITRVNLSTNNDFALPYFSRMSVFASLTAVAWRLPNESASLPATVKSIFRMNLTFYDKTPSEVRELPPVAQTFLVPAGSNHSSAEHILTEFDYAAKKAVFQVGFSDERAYDFQFTSPALRDTFLSLLISFLGILALGVVYVFYRSEIRDEAWERIPPESNLMTYSNIFVFLGSDLWHYLIPVGSPAGIWALTRAVTAMWVWFQRLILLALAKGRNVMERRTISWKELLILGIFAIVEVVETVADGGYYFKFPFGRGTMTTFVCHWLSIGAFATWVIMVGFAWRGDWFFGILFLFVAAGSALGPICDGVLGLFKETYFRFYRTLMPLCLCLLLYILTWPVTTMARGVQRDGRRFDGTGIYH